MSQWSDITKKFAIDKQRSLGLLKQITATQPISDPDYWDGSPLTPHKLKVMEFALSGNQATEENLSTLEICGPSLHGDTIVFKGAFIGESAWESDWCLNATFVYDELLQVWIFREESGKPFGGFENGGYYGYVHVLDFRGYTEA